MPTNLITTIEHHSLADWDFRYPDIHMLSAEHKVSPPSSLKTFGDAPSPAFDVILSRHPLAQNLSFGSISSYFYCKGHAKIHAFLFRDQSPLGQTLPHSRYIVRFTWKTWDFWWQTWWTSIKLAEFNYTTLPDKWYLRAVSWNTVIAPDGSTPLGVTPYQFEDGHWKALAGSWYHPLDYWACSQINRCGLSFQPGTDKPQYADNTKIWTFESLPEELLELIKRTPPPPSPLIPWQEHWGSFLGENNPWTRWMMETPVTVTLLDGICTIVNHTDIDAGIYSRAQPGLLPLQNSNLHPLYIHTHTPEASAVRYSSYSGHELIFTNDIDTFTLYLFFAHGVAFEDEGWGEENGHFLGWITIGTTPTILNLLDLWQSFRDKLGLPQDPTGWYLDYISFGMSTTVPPDEDYLKSDYLFFSYEPHS